MNIPSREGHLLGTTAIAAALEHSSKAEAFRKELLKKPGLARKEKEKVSRDDAVVLLSEDPLRFITPKKGRGIPVYRGFKRRWLKKLQSNYRREQLWAERRKKAEA